MYEPNMPGIFLSIFLLLVVLELIRQRKLFIGYSMLLISSCVTIFLLSLFPKITKIITKLTGIGYGPFFLYTISILLIFAILVDFSIRISTINKQVNDLAVIIAFLKKEKSEEKSESKSHE